MSELINIVEQTTFQIKACYSEIVIKRTIDEKVEEIEAFGLNILPLWLDHKPTKFRTQIIPKSKSGLSEEQLYNDLLEGKYYLNISDYSYNGVMKIMLKYCF